VKKLLSVMLLLVLCLNNFSVYAQGKTEEIKGVGLINLPKKNAVIHHAKIPASLKLNEVLLVDDRLALTGTVRYNNIKFDIDYEGQLYRSHLNTKDILINPVKINHGSDMTIVRWKVFNNPSKNDLVANKNLAGHKTLVLYIFDEKKRDLLSFEIAVDILDIKNIDSENYLTNYGISDAWVYKVMEGDLTSSIDNSFGVLSINNEAKTNFSASILYKDPYGTGCDENHEKHGFVSIVGSTILTDGNYVYSNIKVTSQGITFICGSSYSFQDTEAAVWFGHFSDPVFMKTTFSGKEYRDFVKITDWWGVYLKDSSVTIQASVGVFYGPLSVSGGSTLWRDFYPPSNDPTTIYFGDENYSHTEDYDYKDTKLYNNNDYYTMRSYLGVGAATGSGSKTASIDAKIPVYGNSNGSTYYATKNVNASITYSNY
jgi:hypothetical protein